MRLLKTNEILLGVDDKNGTFYPVKKEEDNCNISAVELEKGLKEQQMISSQTILKLKANGMSMEPIIHHGDLLQLKYTSVEDLKMGDIISYVSKGVIVTHRLIIKINKKGFVKILEKGDNGLFGVIYDPKVLGKIVSIKGKYCVDTNSRLFKVLSKLIVFFTLLFFSVYYILFYIPFFLFELIISKFSWKTATYGFNTKARNLKLKYVLTKSIYPFSWIIVSLFKLICHARK